MEDAAIIRLFFNRDEQAIAETDHKYGRVLVGVSRNIVEDYEDARECVNDCYLAVWQQIPPTCPMNYYAYLCKIVRNLSYNVCEKKHAAKRSAEIVCLSHELDETLPDGDITDEVELGRSIDGFLRGLDQRSRLIFIRRYFYSDPVSKIAEMTGMSANAVSARLSRTRKDLKKHLEREGYTV
ncbi:MAG: RNA polymerase sigma factor [Eubacteriales bacterium]